MNCSKLHSPVEVNKNVFKMISVTKDFLTKISLYAKIAYQVKDKTNTERVLPAVKTVYHRY